MSAWRWVTRVIFIDACGDTLGEKDVYVVYIKKKLWNISTELVCYRPFSSATVNEGAAVSQDQTLNL